MYSGQTFSSDHDRLSHASNIFVEKVNKMEIHDRGNGHCHENPANKTPGTTIRACNLQDLMC